MWQVKWPFSRIYDDLMNKSFYNLGSRKNVPPLSLSGTALPSPPAFISMSLQKRLHSLIRIWARNRLISSCALISSGRWSWGFVGDSRFFSRLAVVPQRACSCASWEYLSDETMWIQREGSEINIRWGSVNNKRLVSLIYNCSQVAFRLRVPVIPVT